MGTLTLRREDGRIVCERCVVADRAHRRFRGLLGRRRLTPGQGMVLRPAFAIHTHFMHFPIDVVFLDSDQVVVAIERNLRPWRTASFRGAREVVELAAGECDRRGLEVGDRVAWASRSAADVRADAATSEWDDSSEPRARVLIASRDPRFVKLARFLLEGRDFEVEELTSPEKLSDAIQDPELDLALLDGGADVAASAAKCEPDACFSTRGPDRGRRRHRRPQPSRHSRVRPLERDRGAAPRRRAPARRAGTEPDTALGRVRRSEGGIES